jgi:hypothetical protein
MIAPSAEAGTMVGHPPGICPTMTNAFTTDLTGYATLATLEKVPVTLTDVDLLLDPDAFLPFGTISVEAELSDIEVQVPDGSGGWQWIPVGNGDLEASATSGVVIWISDVFAQNLPSFCQAWDFLGHPGQVGLIW